MIIKMLAVGVGGFIGSILRFLISQIPMYKTFGSYPMNTFLTNIAGALIIGFVITYARQTDMSPEKLLLLKVGLCGGLTTFSTFSVESLGLIENGNYLMAAAYIIFSVAICIVGVAVGMKAAALV